MDLLLVADGHYYQDKKGDVYVDSTYDYRFYSRYLSVFDRVFAVARIQHVDVAPAGKKKSSGDNVEFLELPEYRGPWQYAKIYFKLRRIAKNYCDEYPCAIFRLPAATSNLLCTTFAKTKKPFAVEIVIDPYENFAHSSIKSILTPIIQHSWTNLVKKMCMKASGASYVTEHYLQEHYPCPALMGDKKHFTAAYSSVELPDDSFAEPRVYKHKDAWIISHSANTFSGYGKGHKTLINALAIIRSKGYDVQVHFIGDGPKRQEFEAFAQEKGVGSSAKFLGKLPSAEAVREELKKTDMFVFPTTAEGLPRGLLEAMAEGLPCLSSPVCGIPEVLDSEYMFDYEDSEGFANGIIKFINNAELMTTESARNLDVSKRYASSLLNAKRKDFYKKLREAADKL